MDRISVKQYRDLLKKEGKVRPARNRTLKPSWEGFEEHEQRLLAEHLDDLGLVWFHVPNGGARNQAEGGKLKAQGVKPGVPDVFIMDPAPNGPAGNCGTVIELKRVEGGRTSKEQKKWLTLLKERGWVVAVCHGAQEAIDLVQKLGYEKGEKS